MLSLLGLCAAALSFGTVRSAAAQNPSVQTALPSALIGETGQVMVREGDTLLDIAVDNDLGYLELLLANPGVDPWVPKPGQTVVLPHQHLLPDAPREGIVINLAELRLYHFPGQGADPVSYPIGIGRLSRETPTGRTRIVRKRTDPTWIPPASIRAEKPELPAVVPPGPDNPLGRHALDLAWPSYLIHGTNRPYGVGRQVSFGCIRMYPADVAELFKRAEIGAPVTIVDQPVKAAWVGGELYLEVHPTALQVTALEATGRLSPYAPPDPMPVIRTLLQGREGTVNQQLIRQIARERSGMPVRITPALAPAAYSAPAYSAPTVLSQQPGG